MLPPLPLSLRPKVKLQPHTGDPLIASSRYADTKDPCPVFDGKLWHIFGSGGTVTTETWHILHATARKLEGPWEEKEAATLLKKSGDHFAAPGVIFDPQDKKFHMFIQSEFTAPGGTIEYFTSKDGNIFTHVSTALRSIPHTRQAGVYDSHPALIKDKRGKEHRYLVYVGYPDMKDEANHTDIYLAKSQSDSWEGPWERLGTILRQEEVNHHNQSDNPDYEWGLEGPQLIQLASGKIILNAVCFLPKGTRGTRQRVFFAFSNHVQGPYQTLGTVLEPTPHKWQSGENGHAAAVIDGENFKLFYQARAVKGLWRYGIASCTVAHLENMLNVHNNINPLNLFRYITFPYLFSSQNKENR